MELSISWIVINEGVARLGGVVSNIHVPCVLCSILYNVHVGQETEYIVCVA